MLEFLNKIPDGWRVYSADWSIKDNCRVGLVRCGDDYKHWFELPYAISDATSLYSFGTGKDFEEAFNNAVKGATPLLDGCVV